MHDLIKMSQTVPKIFRKIIFKMAADRHLDYYRKLQLTINGKNMSGMLISVHVPNLADICVSG